MFKLAKIFLISILIFILIAAILRHTLCRLLICSATAKATGLKLTIEDLNLDVLNNALFMHGITLFNPPEFTNKILGRAKEIFIRYDLLDSARGVLHLRQVKADISEINIITNEQGYTNVSRYRNLKKKQVKAESSTATSLTSPTWEKDKGIKRKGRPKFLIDELELSVKKATYTNYKAEIGQTAAIVFEREDPYVFNNVSGLEDIISPLSAKGNLRIILNTLVGIFKTDSRIY